MSNKPTVKIVKREDRSRAAGIADASPEIIPSEEASTRTMTKTVTGWVKEFKQKGPKAEKLFTNPFARSLRPNET